MQEDLHHHLHHRISTAASHRPTVQENLHHHISTATSHHPTMQENLHHHRHRHRILFSLLLILSTLPLLKSEIQTFKISSDPRPLILFEDFGFNSPGYISASASFITVRSTAAMTPATLSRMGCFYGPSPSRQALEQALLKGVCIIGNPFVFPIFTFDENPKDFNTTLLITIPDLYFIFFLNCVQNSSVSMIFNLQTYNVKTNGDPDYIDEQFANLPTTLFIFSLLYLIFLLAWTYYCNKNKQFLRKIHASMALLLFLRFMELLLYASSQHWIRQTGSSHFYKFLWLVFYFARNLIFINMIMLIRAGWSLFRPNLQNMQKRAVLITISLQILASSCFMLINGFGPSDRNYGFWTVTYYAVDFVCCVIMTLPFSQSIDNLVICGTKIEAKEAKKMVYKKAYENFALALYIYVGFTRLGMFLLRAITSYSLWGLSIALELTIELIFYSVVYSMFWPNERYDYIVLGQDRDEDPSSAASSDSRLEF